MKDITTKLSIGIISLLLLCTACKSGDDSIILSSIGTIKTQKSIYLDQDKITVYSPENISDEYEPGNRVFAYFEILDATSEDNIQIRITNLIKIPVSDITPVIDDENDTLYNASIVSIHRMWLSPDFLTVDFNYFAFDPELHKFQLAKKDTENHTDTIKLDFRHSANNDEKGGQVRNILSFNLSSLKPLPTGKDSIVVSVRTQIYSTDTTSTTNTRYFYYK